MPLADLLRAALRALTHTSFSRSNQNYFPGGSSSDPHLRFRNATTSYSGV